MSSLAARRVHRPQHNAYHTDCPFTQRVLYKQDATITINSYPCWAVKASWSVASNALISHMHSNARCRHEGERSLESVTKGEKHDSDKDALAWPGLAHMAQDVPHNIKLECPAQW
jgi:hypothetical protein